MRFSCFVAGVIALSLLPGDGPITSVNAVNLTQQYQDDAYHAAFAQIF